jgi:pimeloyl-ACP methyl ester carboxylesterase
MALGKREDHRICTRRHSTTPEKVNAGTDSVHAVTAELAGITYDRRGSGSPLVLVHGIGSRWQVWQPVLDALSAHHEVIALDVPGFGASPRPAPGTPAGVPSLCDLLEAFFGKLGIGTPHVAGNSMGGWIALELARRGSVASSTALSPGGFLSFRDNFITVPLLSLQRLAAQLTRPLGPTLFRSESGRKLGWANVVAHPERMSTEDAVLGLQGMADATWFWATLAQLTRTGFSDGAAITVPVTIAWGTKDHLLPPRQAATALAKVPSAAFVSLTDCGHVPMYDNPALVTEVILRTTAAASGAPEAADGSSV